MRWPPHDEPRTPRAHRNRQILEIPRDHAAHIRIELSEFKGHPLVNVRIWETGSDGVDRPTVKGIALGIAKLPELAAGIAKALATARKLGLIDDAEASG
jgi:Transcriptional Coactivator p15 (PC4)